MRLLVEEFEEGPESRVKEEDRLLRDQRGNEVQLLCWKDPVLVGYRQNWPSSPSLGGHESVIGRHRQGWRVDQQNLFVPMPAGFGTNQQGLPRFFAQRNRPSRRQIGVEQFREVMESRS